MKRKFTRLTRRLFCIATTMGLTAAIFSRLLQLLRLNVQNLRRRAIIWTLPDRWLQIFHPSLCGQNWPKL